ncbi:LysR family transcriptional regulator [Corallococcus sp. 4LFB]|uniref:LysR family transcriptional regulator n=1 Tax=Corallococcus sp. 4LFB TaxID=3383249 RepID=UPI003975481A
MTLRTDLLPALAAFESAARHQNFARAAEELHLTASAVSHHVRKLEDRLGVVLFQRHARGVALTAEGRQLADAPAPRCRTWTTCSGASSTRGTRTPWCASPPCTR